LTVESLLQTIEFIWFRNQKVESGDDGSFEFSSLISSNGNWREGFPENGFANVGSNEKGNT